MAKRETAKINILHFRFVDVNDHTVVPHTVNSDPGCIDDGCISVMAGMMFVTFVFTLRVNVTTERQKQR
jgi:hypothetical protein